jgi:hypothetical protein
MTLNDVRARVLSELELLATPSLQLQYEEELRGKAGHVPSELIEAFCSDIYAPASTEFISVFNDGEMKSLSHLYGLMTEASLSTHSTVSSMLKDPAWRKVVALAKDIHSQLGSRAHSGHGPNPAFKRTR